MRVAFNLIPSARWTGGYNYLLNLFRAIRSYEADHISPILFCGDDADDHDLRAFLELGDTEIVRSSVFDARKKASHIVRACLFGVDSHALQVFRRHRVDVVFENATFYGRHFPIPTIAWLPDFQHRHLRDQFGLRAYWRRELGYRAQVASGRMIMLSSEDARRDCERFYRSATGRTAVARFASLISDDVIEADPEKIVQEYRLPSRFFYLPNQFWKHKNHLVVIEALGLLKRQGVDVVVAVTGNPLDPRHPEHIGRLNSRIESMGLQDHFRILGVVPRRHVIALMQTCAALINPSFFEGWSSTVEEARMLGVPMLLSDIAVHREQMEHHATYFRADDAEGLAANLRNMASAGSLVTPARTPDARSHERVRRFARDFFTVVERVLAQPQLKDVA
ncbi:MAG: glycosyltransferase family 4 protein [Nitrospira sp.]|nr:glycosyltransferase family 4 protein [Nitrospira sp.]